jgi:hypothetical protein
LRNPSEYLSNPLKYHWEFGKSQLLRSDSVPPHVKLLPNHRHTGEIGNWYLRTSGAVSENDTSAHFLLSARFINQSDLLAIRGQFAVLPPTSKIITLRFVII